MAHSILLFFKNCIRSSGSFSWSSGAWYVSVRAFLTTVFRPCTLSSKSILRNQVNYSNSLTVTMYRKYTRQICVTNRLIAKDRRDGKKEWSGLKQVEQRGMKDDEEITKRMKTTWLAGMSLFMYHPFFQMQDYVHDHRRRGDCLLSQGQSVVDLPLNTWGISYCG